MWIQHFFLECFISLVTEYSVRKCRIRKYLWKTKIKLEFLVFFVLLRGFPTIGIWYSQNDGFFWFSKDILEYVIWECHIAPKGDLRSLLKFVGTTFSIKLFKLRFGRFWSWVISHVREFPTILKIKIILSKLEKSQYNRKSGNHGRK